MFITFSSTKMPDKCWKVLRNLVYTSWQLLGKSGDTPGNFKNIICAGDIKTASLLGVVILNTIFEEERCLSFLYFFISFIFLY